jgi:hypothetical protein
MAPNASADGRQDGVAAAPPPPAAAEGAEEDWFRVKIDAAGLRILNVDVTGVPGVDPILEIYDANLYKIKEQGGGGPGEPERLRDFGVRGPAVYFLRLRSKSRLAANAQVPYQITTELLPYEGTSEFEPNDQRQDATPFERGSMGGTIGTAGDQDWYKVVVPQDGRQLLTAQVTSVPGMDLVLSLRDELGNPILAFDDGGKEQPEAVTGFGVGKGTYYLVVSEKSGRKADTQHGYTISRTVVPAAPGLEFESNDSTATAQALKVGESVDGYLAPKGDVDYYEFNVYQKSRITAELTGLLNVRWSAALSDQDGRELARAAGRKSGEALSLSQDLDPGTYLLRLSASDPGQVNVRDKYTLRLRAQ